MVEPFMVKIGQFNFVTVMEIFFEAKKQWWCLEGFSIDPRRTSDLKKRFLSRRYHD
jgi:hypothetical protein